MKSTIKKLSTTSVALLITACSSVANIDSEPYGQGYGSQLKGQELYAMLSKGESGHYEFTRFTTARPNSKTTSAWVDLNQLNPIFSTLGSDCSTETMFGVESQNDQVCSDIKTRENLFYDSSITTGDVLANTLLNTFATVYTLGTAVKGYYTVEFNEEAYIDALKEAKANFDIQPVLVALNKFDAELVQRKKILNTEIESKRALLDKSIKVNFIDKSKLFGELPKDIVSIGIKSSESRFESVRTKAFNKVEDLYIELDKIDAQIRSDVKFKTYCNISLFSGWNYSISGCDFTADLNDKSLEQISLTVISKKEFYVPYFPSMTDKVVVVKAENGRLKIHNKTGKYLKIDSVSMYVDNDIETRTNLNVEVPPQAISTIVGLNRFPDSERRRTLHNVDQTLLKHPIELGTAVKYRIADTNVEKTLYKVDAVTPYRYY